MKLLLYSDGGSRGNPGISGAGFVIYDNQGTCIARKAVPLGIATNNQAEYVAISEGLKHALTYKPEEITCRLDSELIVKQMNGEYRVKDPILKQIYAEIKKRIAGTHVSFHHIPREKNKEADKLSNDAMDKSGSTPFALNNWISS